MTCQTLIFYTFRYFSLNLSLSGPLSQTMGFNHWGGNQIDFLNLYIAFNAGWKENHDDDAAVRLPFPYTQVVHFDQASKRLFLWASLFRFFHYISYLATWRGPFYLLNFGLSFTCATLKCKKGPIILFWFLK